MDTYILREFIEDIPMCESATADAKKYKNSEKYKKLTAEIKETTKTAKSYYRKSSTDPQMKKAANKEYKKLIGLMKERNSLASKMIGDDTDVERFFKPLAYSALLGLAIAAGGTVIAGSAIGASAGVGGALGEYIGRTNGLGAHIAAPGTKVGSKTWTKSKVLQHYAYELKAAENMEKKTR